MRSIQQEQQTRLIFLSLALALAILLPRESHSFQPISSVTRKATNTRQQSRLNVAIIDPADIPVILTTAQHATDLPIPPLAAMLTSAIDLSSGSIAPSVDALAQLHAAGAATAVPVAKAATATIQEMLPGAGDAMQAQAQDALNSGFKVMDATKFIHGGAPSLPGFSETNSILEPHLLPGPSDESVAMSSWPENMFKFRIEFASTMLRAIQKLPYVAFGYALLEFFFLRSDVDLYKEDIEDDPSGVFAESVSDAGVRAAIFFGLAVMTYVVS